MTDIEQKALALVRDVADGYEDVSIHHVHNAKALRSALCRAIEQHEAFKQDVSEFALGVKGYMASVKAMAWQSDCDEFIIAKPDPLVDAWLDAFPGNHIDDAREECAKISAALAARGLEVRKIGEGE